MPECSEISNGCLWHWKIRQILQCRYSAIFECFYPKMCYTVWGGVIDDELGKRIGDIGIQKNYRRIERGYDFDFFYFE